MLSQLNAYFWIEAICRGQREGKEQIELIEMLILAGADTQLKDNGKYKGSDRLEYSTLSQQNRQKIIRTIN